MQEYTVQRGDNLTKIARKFGIDSWRKIWNFEDNKGKIPNPNKIKVGQKINIPIATGGLPFDDDEFEFEQEDYKEKIKEYFGHMIAVVKFPGDKKARNNKRQLENELLDAKDNEYMTGEEVTQFINGAKILKALSYSLGGEFGTESSIERYLDHSEVRPIQITKQYKAQRRDYEFFADAWYTTAMEHYDYTGKEQSLTGVSPRKVASAIKEYIVQNSHFLKEEIPAAELDQVLDIEDLPDPQRYIAYTILRQGGHEFTDLEMNDYLRMLDDRAGNLSDGETNFILKNTDMSDLPATDDTEPELEDEEGDET